MGKRCKNTARSSVTNFVLSPVYNVCSQHHKKRPSDGTGSSKSFQLNTCSFLPRTREQCMALDLMSPSYLYRINMTFLSVRWQWDRGSIFSVPKWFELYGLFNLHPQKNISIEPPCVITSHKQPRPISDCIQNTKIFPFKALQLEPLVKDHLL